MAEPLENDPSNACFGCGPDHPLGLRLAFRRDGSAVRTELVATDRREGWPGRLHSGILYLAMLETANWTLYGLHNRVGVPVRTSALDARRWIATGESLALAGAAAKPDRGDFGVVVEARDSEARVVATLARDYDLPDRATFLRRMGYETLPAAFEGLRWDS